MVAQTNSDMPFMPGDADVAAGCIRSRARLPATDFPLFAPPREPVDLTEYAAGLHAALLVPDGGTLQLGIGALGDAVAQALILRHSHNATFKQIVALASQPIPAGRPASKMPLPSAFTAAARCSSRAFST